VKPATLVLHSQLALPICNLYFLPEDYESLCSRVNHGYDQYMPDASTRNTFALFTGETFLRLDFRSVTRAMVMPSPDFALLRNVKHPRQNVSERFLLRVQ